MKENLIRKVKELLVTPEDEYHDFKYQWYSPNDKSEFIKDIFSFVNTTHHEDCYLIIGVDDNKNIVGVKNDKNRLNTQKITDYLHQLPIANSQIPKISVNTLTIDSHEIDVIVIKDTSDVPIYLTEDKHPKGAPRPIHAGQIFVRENDTNTPINRSASDYQVERLWKKRFGLDLPILDQYKVKLRDLDNWKYFEGDEVGLRYDVDPDYCIYIKEDKEGRNKIQSYCLGQMRPSIDWRKVLLKYKDKVIFEELGVYMDNFSFFTIAPELGVIPPSDMDALTFQYFITDSLKYLLEQLFISKKYYELSPGKDQKERLFQRIVIFKDNDQKERVLERLSRKKDYIKNHSTLTKEEQERYKSIVIFNLGKDAYEANPDYINRMCREAKVSQFIKVYLEDMVNLGSISNK